MKLRSYDDIIADKAQIDRSYCLTIVQQHRLMNVQMFAWQRSYNPLKRIFGYIWQRELIKRIVTKDLSK